MPWAPQAKKLVSVLATSLLVTDASRKASKVRVLDKIPCIYYHVQFRKDKGQDVLALLNSGSEVNTMTPAYAAYLGLKVRMTNVDAQKIDELLLATYGMVIAAFQFVDKLGRSRFFQETFLLADISMEVVLSMPFLNFSNADVEFAEKEFTWRTYTTKKAFPTTRWVEIIDRKDFTEAALDENVEAFVVHVSSLESRMTIHPAREAQLALLLTEEVTVPVEYSDFADVFSEKSVNVLPKRIGVYEHAIKLEEGKQPLYRPIYSLGSVELKTLKTYIEINLTNGFIWASKSPADAPILFVRKPDGSLCLCVNYQRLNNLMIKNRNPLPLIGKSLNRLGQAKQFNQLDLTSVYHRMRIKEDNEWKMALPDLIRPFRVPGNAFWAV